MLTAEEQMELTVLKKHGAGIRELARATGRSRNTVRRYLREGDAAGARKPAPKRAEKLDPFKGYVVERLAAAAPAPIPATVLLREIGERGYDGGITRLKQFVRGLVPAPAPEPVVRFETEPGQQMQADWATVGHGSDKLKVFIATLGWSRATYVEFCDDECVETLMAAHETAFVAFGGVAREVRRLPAAAVPAVPGADEGQGGALHRLLEAQLLGAVRRHHAPGRPGARQARGECSGGALAARGGQRPRACDDQ